MTSSSSKKISTKKGETWWDTLYDVVVNEELDLIAEESSDDKENALLLNDVRGSKEEGKPRPCQLKGSFFYIQYMIVKANEWVDRSCTGSIWNPDSRLGAVFRNRFRVPNEIFDCICRD